MRTYLHNSTLAHILRIAAPSGIIYTLVFKLERHLYIDISFMMFYSFSLSHIGVSIYTQTRNMYYLLKIEDGERETSVNTSSPSIFYDPGTS